MNFRNYTLVLTTDGPIPQTVGRLLSDIRTELLTFTYPPAGDGPVEAQLRGSADPTVVAAVVRHALAPLGRGILAGQLVYDADADADADTDAAPYAGVDLFCPRRSAGCPLLPHQGPCPAPQPPVARHTLVDVTLRGGMGPYRATIIGYHEPGSTPPAAISRSGLQRIGEDLNTAGRGQLLLAEDGTAIVITSTAEGTPSKLLLDRDDDGLYRLPHGWAETVRPIRTRLNYHGLTFRRAFVRRPDLADGYPALLIQPEYRRVVPWLSRDTLLQLAYDLHDTNAQYDGEGGDQIVFTDPDAVLFRVDHNQRNAGPVAILRPNRLGLYPTGRTRIAWTAQPTAEPPLTVATVTLAGTSIEVDAFVPRESPIGQPVNPMLTSSGITQLATALYTAGQQQTRARLTVEGHVVHLHTPGTGPAAAEVLRPDGFGLRQVPVDGWRWHRTS
ncbi:hypothetical protein HDA40_002142 [Hamadaea flava]|uniref:Uncharacterized protein n=1 Tax=Hamadaea flava TaxID=1742688 RepID=A0ABV8LLN2_9ACTN|nr:hypothetical protein [Hamadaea flava]MCP2323635.1 hypothetical protein [Hamadaea flava]